MGEPLELILREQFHEPQQQRETATLGMWVFISTEVLLFGGLFMAFTVYRMYYPQAFIAGSADMNIALGAINTAVLICSSFTMALAVHSAELGNSKLINVFLAITMVLGAVFLTIKFTEYYLHYLDHRLPGPGFRFPGADAPKVEMFFLFYFIMTGLHALHMFIGEGILFSMVLRNSVGSFSSEYHTPVVLAGLYWHFVDVVWVFLFAIFYIEGLHLHKL